MAKTRSLEVIISGDPKQLTRAFGNIDKSAQHTEGRLHRMGKVGALAFGGLATAAAGAAVVGLKKSADAAIEAEKAQARMTAQLKASGISYRAHAKEIDAVIQRTSKLAGLDDEDLQDAFTNIVRSTGSVDKGLRNIGLAADIARAKHIDVAKAGQLLGRVATGNVTALSRYGIQIDKNATSSEALAVLQKRFSGQAEAYGKTTAGSMERAGVAAENLGEAVGAKLAPFIAKGANALTDLIDRSGEAAGPIRRITGTIADAYNSIRRAVTRFADTNREDIRAVVSAVRNLGRFFKNVFENVILPAVRNTLPGIKEALGGIITVVRGVVRVVTGLINGDWKRAWNGLKDIVSGAFRLVRGVIRGAVGGIGTLMLNLGKAAGAKILEGLGNLGHLILDKIKGALGFVKDNVGGLFKGIGSAIGIGDGLGKAIGDGLGGGLPAIPNLTGVGAGNLMGAQGALSPFAAIGSRFGLHVSSGRRPGSITSSGNVSYHSTGEAIDMADGRGPDAPKMGFFRYMKSHFGSRLAELIYTPGGPGIKDGRPFQYTGQVARDHFDHVHVALDTGRPGVGDGPGKTRTGELGWLSSMWERVAPLWGMSGKTPIAGLFKHVRLSGSSPFVGVSSDPGAKGHETDELLWPSWVWRGNKDQPALDNKTKQKLFIHEMAHRFQVPGATKSTWEMEGGAEAFARIVMSRMFGGYDKDPSDPYNKFSQRVIKDHGWGWVTKTQFGKGDGIGRKRFTGDGIGQAASAARAAGFRGSDLVTILAIAGAESGWKNSATNLKYPDHSIGMWQINQLAHHGRFGSDAALRNPATNARAAFALFKGRGGFGDWSTFSNGSYRSYLAQARRAAIGSRSSSSRGGTSTGSTPSSGASSDPSPHEQRVAAQREAHDQRVASQREADTAVSPYEMATALSDVQLAQAEGTTSTADDLRAKIVRRSIVSARIKKIRAALGRRGLRTSTRLRLTQELASLRGEHNQLQTDIRDIRHPAVDAAATTTDEGGGDNQALIDAIAAQTQAEQEHTQALVDHMNSLQALQNEIATQNKIAGSTIGIGLREAQRALADMISGQLGGLTAGRALTAGAGTVVRY